MGARPLQERVAARSSRSRRTPSPAARRGTITGSSSPPRRCEPARHDALRRHRDGAKGTRATGLTVQVAAAGVTGVAICTQVRSFDLVARLRNGSATRVGMASAEVMDEIAARIASLIEPAVPAPQSALGHSARAVKPSRPGRGTP